MKKRILTALGFLDKIEDWFLIILLTVMVILAVAQIVYRNVFGIGLLWADPMLRTMVLWIALAGAVIATRTDNHIRIDFFTRYMSEKYSAYVHRVVYIFSVAVCSLVAWHAYRFVASEYEYGTTAFLNIPAWVTASIIPIGFGMMAFRYFLLFLTPPGPDAKSYIVPEDES